MTYPSAYSTLVSRLFKPGDEILRTLDPDRCALLHAIVGLGGELGELILADVNNDVSELPLEIGDLFFYCRAIRNTLSLEFSSVTVTSYLDIITHLFGNKSGAGTPFEVMAVSIGNIIDHIKRYVIYDRPLKPAHRKTLNRELGYLELLLCMLASEHNYTAHSIIKLNQDKLLERYPSVSYANSSALSKADQNESKN